MQNGSSNSIEDFLVGLLFAQILAVQGDEIKKKTWKRFMLEVWNCSLYTNIFYTYPCKSLREKQESSENPMRIRQESYDQDAA